MKITPHEYLLIEGGHQFIEQLAKDLFQAEKFANFQFFTFEGDSAGKTFTDLLLKSREKNIEIKLSIDYYSDLYHSDFSLKQPRLNRKITTAVKQEWESTLNLFSLMKKSGIEIKRTPPEKFPLIKFIRRNHKKIIVIDNKIAYVGGINISDHNFLWHDLMFRITGPIVQEINQDFCQTWKKGHAPAQIKNCQGDFLLTQNYHHSLILEKACELIKNAKERVIIESPYFNGFGLNRAVYQTLLRGIPITLITPMNKNRQVPWYTQYQEKTFTKKGVEIYHYQEQGGMTHAKIMIVDNQVFFGSSNFDQFFEGRQSDINILSGNPQLLAQTLSLLERDKKNSQILKI